MPVESELLISPEMWQPLKKLLAIAASWRKLTLQNFEKQTSLERKMMDLEFAAPQGHARTSLKISPKPLSSRHEAGSLFGRIKELQSVGMPVQ